MKFKSFSLLSLCFLVFQAVPEDPTSFNSRKKLPADWCGLRDEILSEKVISIFSYGMTIENSTEEKRLIRLIKRFYENKT